MKSNKIYLIKTLNIPTDEKVAKKLVMEVADCLDDSDEGNFVVEDVDGLDYLFLRVEDYKVDKICKVLDNYIRYQIKEITKDLLIGNHDLNYIIEKEEFKPFFDSFRIDNTTIDDVLDKINNKGFESLDEIDKTILNKEKI